MTAIKHSQTGAELDAAMLAGGPPAAQQNYVVRLVGLVSTDVEVCASSPEEAAEKAEAWAQGKHDKDEHNDLFLWDWERDECSDTVWLSEDQTPCQNGSPKDGA